MAKRLLCVSSMRPSTCSRALLGLTVALGLQTLPSRAAWAGDDEADLEDSGEAELAPLPELPPNVVVKRRGRVVVTRTPEAAVDLEAATPAGTVRAYGCDRVEVDPTTAAPPLPCPYAAAPPPAYYQAPLAYVPRRFEYAPPFEKRKPKWERDPGRTGALIASSLVFGLGTAGAGGAYVASITTEDGFACSSSYGCSREPSTPALMAMGGFMTIAPSVPRYVVGDVGMGLLFTGLRAGSFAAGTAIDWKDESHVLPVTFAFVLPVTLGIIDLATTPHREELDRDFDTDERAQAAVHLDGLGPTATVDARGALAPALGALGRF